jgi:hypothetical protein
MNFPVLFLKPFMKSNAEDVDANEKLSQIDDV